MNITEEIKLIESKLAYSFIDTRKYKENGETKDSYLFFMLYPGQVRSHYHYYVVKSCSYCNKPYLVRKYTKSNMHKQCAMKLLNEKKVLSSNLS